jgi:hypothetical protein
MARHLKCFILTHFALCVVVTCSTGLAQTSTSRPRIVTMIDNTHRAALPGTHPSRARSADDIGAVASDFQLRGVTLVFSRTAAQQTALDQLATAQQDTSSPLYHHWLSSEQFAARFGAADADIATASRWLESEGFRVDSVSRSRSRIFFSGTAGNVSHAFGVALHHYKAKSETTSHFAPSTSLSIPAALAPAVMTVVNLSNYRPVSNIVAGRHKTLPLVTPVQADVFLTPPGVATVYDVKPIYESGCNGSGQLIAVVGQSAVVAQDLANFQVALGVPIKPQSLNLVPGSGASAIRTMDEAEGDLDLEYTSAMAPGASVAYYYSGDSGDAITAAEYVIDNNLAQILSISFGFCEVPGDEQYVASIDAVLEQGAVQGQTIVVASGDNGSTACNGFGEGAPASLRYTPAVSYPGSSPWVVSMGGTEFPAADVTMSPINETYWTPPSGDDPLAAPISYIPETVWNDTYSGNDAGGGGASIMELLPAWQIGVPGIPGGTQRLVPDLSLASSAINPGYLICSTDPAVSEGSGSCNAGFFVGANLPSVTEVGGTSVAAPIFAGLVAVLNQVKGYAGGQGLLNPVLYTLASDPAIYAAAFHDITEGGNNCTRAICGVGPQTTDYLAGVGYDEASGLGSIDFANLVAAWPSATDADPVTTTTTVKVSSTTPLYGATVTLTATVVNGSGGAVMFSDNSTALGYPVTVNSSGVAVMSLSTLPRGSNAITAAYVGTTLCSPSTSPSVLVSVGLIPSTTNVTASPQLSVFGMSVTLIATVTGADPSSGDLVMFANHSAMIGSASKSGLNVATLILSTLPVGTNVITASYPGTATVAASISAPVTVIVVPAVTATTITASAYTPVSGANVVLSARVTSNGPPVPGGGSISFFDGSMGLGSEAMDGDGVVALSLSTLPTGMHSITASYPGTSTLPPSVSAAIAVSVAPDPTTTVISASNLNPLYGSNVTFLVAVSTNGIPVSSGFVRLFNGGNSIGSGAPNSSGIVSLTLSSLPVGSNTITAEYAGTADLGDSTSAAVVVIVSNPVSPVTPITITIATPSPVSPGSTVSTAVNISAGSSYSGTIHLTCALTSSPVGALYLPTCSLNPNTVTVAANEIEASTLTVQTTSVSESAISDKGPMKPWRFGEISTMAVLVLFLLPSRRRPTAGLLAALLVVLSIGTVGCGGGNQPLPTGGTHLTTAGSYSFVVKETDAGNASATASSTVTLTVT